MKRSNFLVAASAILLTVGAFITTKAKAHKKGGTHATQAYFTPNNGTTWFKIFTNGLSSLITSGTSGQTAKVKTGSVNSYTMFSTTLTTSHKLYYR